MKKFVVINTDFTALHAWPDCPLEEVAFLKNSHRHLFKVKMKWPVTHSNRELEFFVLKDRLNRFLWLNWDRQDLGNKSCEMMAEGLLQAFPNAVSASVFEDGENGAEVWR